MTQFVNFAIGEYGDMLCEGKSLNRARKESSQNCLQHQ